MVTIHKGDGDISQWTEVESRRLAHIERRLGEIGAAAKGQREFHADRLSDVLDQIDALRKELTELAERVQRMADFLNQLKSERKNGGDE